MVSNNRPTSAQLGALSNMIRWKLTDAECKKTIEYLENHSTRGEVSEELKRVRQLYISRKLVRDNVWASGIYKDMN